MFEFKTIFRNVLALSLSLMLFCLYLESMEKSVEFYSEQNIPHYLQMYKGQGDLTVLKVTGWPKKSKVSISERGQLRPSRIVASNFSPINGEVIFVIASIGYFPGVPVTYTFSDEKKHLKEEFETIPWRIFAKSTQDGAELEAKLLDFGAGTFMVTLRDFDEKEDLIYTSKSYDEIMETPLNLRCIFYAPAVIGKKGGVAEIHLRRSSGEVLHIELPWGFEFYKYILSGNGDGTGSRLIDDPQFRKEQPEVAKYFDSKK